MQNLTQALRILLQMVFDTILHLCENLTGGAASLQKALMKSLSAIGQNTTSSQCQSIVNTILCAAARSVSDSESFFSLVWLVAVRDLC